MRKNVGTVERWLRAVAAAGFLTCSMMAPLAAAMRVPLFGLMGLYMAATAVAGTCLLRPLLAGRSPRATEPRA